MVGCGIVAIPHTIQLTQSVPAFFVINATVILSLLLTTWMMLQVRSNIEVLFAMGKADVKTKRDDDEVPLIRAPSSSSLNQ